MALFRTGGLILKSIKPVLQNTNSIIPSSVDHQVRHAARKGYRDMLKQKKRKEALLNKPTLVVEGPFKSKKKFTRIAKTVDLAKPEPPQDDIIILNNFNYKKFALPEAISLHREYHHPLVFNNPSAPVYMRIEICMFGRNERTYIKPFHGIAAIPHPFVLTHKREVLVICQPEDVELALSNGAAVAGGLDVIKKIQEGVIQPALYDYIVAHTSLLPHLTPIRALLKNQFPKARDGNLTNDLKTAIDKFLNGIKYACAQAGSAQDFGYVDCAIGTIDMDADKLVENLKALCAEIEKFRPKQNRDFITWLWCLSPPSPEKFSVDKSEYTRTVRDDEDDDDDEEEMSEKQKEKLAAKTLLNELKENEGLTERASA